MTENSQGTVDAFDVDAILAVDADGPTVTITLPTNPGGADADRMSLTLKNQVRTAQSRLEEAGVDAEAAKDILAPAAELVGDSSYWRLQSRGLIVFAAAGFHRAVRVPIELPESVSVGDDLCLLPLAPLLATGGKCYILTVSKNAVRLFDSTRNTIEELPLEDIPASFDDVYAERPEKTIDMRASANGPGGAPLSHGADTDPERRLVEGYIHEIGQEVGKRLGTARSQPLVLASVTEYLSVFRDSCPYPAIVDEVVAGNHDTTNPEELRSAAWHVLREQEAAHESEELERARSLAHNGRGSFDVAEIARAAAEGRVETLLLPRDPAAIEGDEPRRLANEALLGTLRTSGTVRALEALDGEELATFRY